MTQWTTDQHPTRICYVEVKDHQTGVREQTVTDPGVNLWTDKCQLWTMDMIHYIQYLGSKVMRFRYFSHPIVTFIHSFHCVLYDRGCYGQILTDNTMSSLHCPCFECGWMHYLFCLPLTWQVRQALSLFWDLCFTNKHGEMKKWVGGRWSSCVWCCPSLQHRMNSTEPLNSSTSTPVFVNSILSYFYTEERIMFQRWTL